MTPEDDSVAVALVQAVRRGSGLAALEQLLTT
jgi:hypothetical protein